LHRLTQRSFSHVAHEERADRTRLTLPRYDMGGKDSTLDVTKAIADCASS